MKHLFIFTALALAASAASATYCASNSTHPGAGAPTWPDHCNDPVSTPNPSTVTGEQRQQQGQAQGQQQVASARAGAQSTAGASSSLNAAGVGASAGAGAGAGAGSNNATSQTTTVNTGGAAGSGDRYVSVALPPTPPAYAPTMVAGPIAFANMGCGPLIREEAENVYGEATGFFGSKQVYLGQKINFRPYLDENGNPQMYIKRDGRWWGHAVLREAAVVSVATGSSFGLGGAGANGGGNVGVGSSGGMTRMGGDINYRFCDAGPAEAPEQPMRIVFEERPVPRPPKQKPVRKVVQRCPSGELLQCRSLVLESGHGVASRGAAR